MSFLFTAAAESSLLAIISALSVSTDLFEDVCLCLNVLNKQSGLNWIIINKSWCHQSEGASLITAQ